jgi:hypothetical protein
MSVRLEGIDTVCENGSRYGVWVEGQRFDPDVVLETRTAAVTGDDEPLVGYVAPSWLGPHEIMICLATDEERVALDGVGLRVTLVNPSRPAASSTISLQ